MGKRTLLFVVVVSFWARTISAQIGPPKHADNLVERFDELKCALVQIESGLRRGTGFYVSADGDIVTAAHVLGDVGGWRDEKEQTHIRLVLPQFISITTDRLTNDKAKKTKIPIESAIEKNPDAWLADLARFKTGKATSCWLQEGDDQKIVPGTHLLTMGFPGISFGVLTMDSGVMTARLPPNYLPATIKLDGGEYVRAPNDFIRVQMPLSAGLSGAPIIDDENRVLALVHSGGVWTEPLETLLQDYTNGKYNEPPRGATPEQKEITHLYYVTGQLVTLIRFYASLGGYGDTVPLRYLGKTP
jgi:hypothetical protein